VDAAAGGGEGGPDMNVAQNDRLFFGVGTRPGHYWWSVGAEPAALVFSGLKAGLDGRVGDCPFTYEVDGRLQPGGDLKDEEGKCLLHLRNGWTAIAWWDRSGPDKRPGCCSAFVMRGEHAFSSMVAELYRSFPWAANRISFAMERVEQKL